MRAAVTDGRGGFAIREIEIDPPGPGEALVRIAASGVCHTDWDKLHQARGPTILGHEGAGTVERIGEAIPDLAVGDRVALNWAIPCGHCFQCRRGNEFVCEAQPLVADERVRVDGVPAPRWFGLGTMATHALVPRAAIVRIDCEMPFPAAAIVGCGVMTGVGSVLNAARVEPGSTVVVIGAGGVGLNVVQGARIAGAARILTIDVRRERLAMAERFGASEGILAERGDAELIGAAADVRARTGGRGADYAFECTAVPALGAAPLRMVRHGGMAVQVSGIEQPLEIDMELFEWNKLYLNPLYGNCRPQVDFPRLFRFWERGLLLLEELVTREYALDELEQAFADLLAGRNAKGVLRP